MSIDEPGGRPAAVPRLLAAVPTVDAPYLCRWGHGPLTGWRARPGGRRGLYCLVCNVEANRRWRARHARAR
jgi:hypothetical protein